jgi:hypothetical protein
LPSLLQIIPEKSGKSGINERGIGIAIHRGATGQLHYKQNDSVETERDAKYTFNKTQRFGETAGTEGRTGGNGSSRAQDGCGYCENVGE